MESPLVYQERPPVPALSAYLKCLWSLRGPASRAAPPDRVVPDGCPELIVHLGDPFVQVRDASEDDRAGASDDDRPAEAAHCESQPQVLIAGQLTRPLVLAATGVIDLVGIRFRPAGLFALLGGRSVGEFVDQRVDVSAIDRLLASRLGDLAALTSSENRLQQAERLIYQRLVAGPGRQRPGRTVAGDPLVQAATTLLESSAGALGVAALASRLRVSVRFLQRGFAREVGLSPKALGRVLRFQRAFHTMPTATRSGAQLALDCGYFDQSHMIRDFRQFAGRSPGAVAAGDERMAVLFC